MIKNSILYICGITHLVSIGLCSHSSDPWTDVASTSQYSNLPDCAQKCLFNVNTYWGCVDYSCVCSENDLLGTNYKASFTNVSACAMRNCQNQAIANEAVY